MFDMPLQHLLRPVRDHLTRIALASAPDKLEGPPDWRTQRISEPNCEYVIQYVTNSPTEPVAVVEVKVDGQPMIQMTIDLTDHYQKAMPGL